MMMVYSDISRHDDGRSFIRKAMAGAMFCAVQENDPGFHGHLAGLLKEEDEEGDEEENKGEDQENGWGDHAAVPTAGPREAIESAASACVFWCTVAVGCLVGGRPKSSVRPTIVCKRLFHGSGGGGDSRMGWGVHSPGLVMLGL